MQLNMSAVARIAAVIKLAVLRNERRFLGRGGGGQDGLGELAVTWILSVLAANFSVSLAGFS